MSAISDKASEIGKHRISKGRSEQMDRWAALHNRVLHLRKAADLLKHVKSEMLLAGYMECDSAYDSLTKLRGDVLAELNNTEAEQKKEGITL